jgi:hypothetical protein
VVAASQCRSLRPRRAGRPHSQIDRHVSYLTRSRHEQPSPQAQKNHPSHHRTVGIHHRKGLLFHASGPIEEGWGAIDFWESRQDFDAFEPRIGAAAAAAGIQLQGPPAITQFSVHETYTG